MHLPITQIAIVQSLATPITVTAIPIAAAPPPPTSPSMEMVWHSEFDRLFSSFLYTFGHHWQLFPTPICPDPSFRLFHDAAKVRFLCQNCGHGWTSMKGRVVFWFDFDAFSNEAFTFSKACVFFKLFGQKCQNCSNNGRFEHAMWYPEEVHKVLYNVFCKVAQTYYGLQLRFCRDRRFGQPRSQHPAELCQACQLGVCANGNRLKQQQQQLTNKSSGETDKSDEGRVDRTAPSG